jgi:heparosan-N-sulfate-glucuronate 5-epimerase
MLKRLTELLSVYVAPRLTGRATTATFWYRPDPPNLRSSIDLSAYLAQQPSPRFVVDYRSRTDFPLLNDDGIVMLPYGGTIGDQVNPEAAFQTALGHHDRWLAGEGDSHRVRFLAYADYFRERQTSDGDWNYLFDWYESKAPWPSALAQARGASVMLRAFLITSDASYKEATLKSISKFAIPTSEGGFAASFPPTDTLYFEEYPKQMNGTFNGFIAALFGLWEVSTWLKDEAATKLFREGLVSAERMLPTFTSSWWTRYDWQGPDAPFNPHSPRYHEMTTGYLVALATLSESETVAHYAGLWKSFDRWPNRWLAALLKARYKLLYR